MLLCNPLEAGAGRAGEGAMNNEVRDGRGRIVGFRCYECDKVKSKMWGEICNECRAKQERHEELLAAMEKRVTG